MSHTARSALAAHHGVCPSAARKILDRMGKNERRPWRDGKDAGQWQRPPTSGKWDYWPGSWKASPKARAQFPSYDRNWSEAKITIVKEERFSGTATEEESIAKPVQQAVNNLRKAEARVSRICREQKEKSARWMAYQREVKAAFLEEEKLHGAAQERLAGELKDAQQQQEVAKVALAHTMESIFGSAMDVSREGQAPPRLDSGAWDRMFSQEGAVPQQAAMDPALLDLLRMYKQGQLPGVAPQTGHPPPGFAMPAAVRGPMAAPDGWPAGNMLPHGPAQPTYGAPPPSSFAKPSPFPPSSPNPLQASMEAANSGHYESGTANVTPPPHPPSVQSTGPSGPGALPGATHDGATADVSAGQMPPMQPVELPAPGGTSPLTEMLRVKRQEARHAMEPFGVPKKTEQQAEPPPPDPGTGPAETKAPPSIVEDDDEELDQARIGSASPGLGKLE